MNVFTEEGMNILLTLLVFSFLLGAVLIYAPQYTDMLIGVAEASVR